MAVLLRMDELKMPIDDIVFVDTGWEFPETLLTINQAKNHFSYKFTIIDLSKKFHYIFWQHIVKSGKHKGKRAGFPSFKMRWCSREKGRAIDHYINSYGRSNAIQYIGFAYDEYHRSIRFEISRKKNKEYPLIDWQWTERKCLKYCYEKGFNFFGYYEKFNRNGCFCCPLQSLRDLKTLYKFYPDLWEKLRKMQESCHYSFRPDYSVFDLEKRFQEEEKQIELFSK